MPISPIFRKNLQRAIDGILDNFETPFHVTDKYEMIASTRGVVVAFNSEYFRNFYIVKDNPNPSIMEIAYRMGYGFMCQSVTELRLARLVGARPREILYYVQNSIIEELNGLQKEKSFMPIFEDCTHVDKIQSMPETIFLQYDYDENVDFENAIKQFGTAGRLAADNGAKRVCVRFCLKKQELSYRNITAQFDNAMEVAAHLYFDTGLSVDYICIGGGYGYSQKQHENQLNVTKLSENLKKAMTTHQFKDFTPKVFIEHGASFVNPHSVLVTRVTNRTTNPNTGETIIEVDAGIPSSFQGKREYHITALKGGLEKEVSSITSSSNNEVVIYANNKNLPVFEEDDVICIEDTSGGPINQHRQLELFLIENGKIEVMKDIQDFLNKET